MMHLTKKVRINLLWVHEDYLKPAIYDLKYTLRTEVKNDSTREQLAEQQNISFVLLNFFINEYLHNTVIYETKQRAWLEKFMPEFNNTLTILPELTESMFLSAIHSKFNTLVMEDTIVEHIEIVDVAQDLSYNYFNDTFKYEELPNMEDWLGELSFWKTPWYFRKDLSTFDNVALTQEEYDLWSKDEERQEVVSQLELAYNELLNDIKQEYSNSLPSTPKEGKIIELTKEKKRNHLKLVPKEPK